MPLGTRLAYLILKMPFREEDFNSRRDSSSVYLKNANVPPGTCFPKDRL